MCLVGKTVNSYGILTDFVPFYINASRTTTETTTTTNASIIYIPIRTSKKHNLFSIAFVNFFFDCKTKKKQQQKIHRK